MSRPPVSVVMPFAGDAAAAARAVAALRSLTVSDGDELVLSDNSGGVAGAPTDGVDRRARSGRALARRMRATPAPPARAANGSCSSTRTAARIQG